MSFFYNLNKRLADLSAKQDATHLAESKQAKTVAQSPLTQALNEAGQRRGLHGEPEFVGIPGPAKGTKPSPKAITKGADREYYKSPGLMGEPERTRWRKKVEEPKVDEAGYSAKSARAGHDIGKPGKNFAKIAKSAGSKYGSKAAGERVAGAVLNKLRHPTNEGTCPSCKCNPCECVEEGNAFTGELKATPKGEKFKLGNKEFKDTSSIEENYNPVKAVKQCAKDYMKMNGIRSVHDLEAEDIESIGGDCQINYQDVCEILGCNLPDSLGPVKSWDTDEHGNKFDLEEGFADMDAWLASREKEKGTGNFDRKERTLPGGMKATTYTRKHEDDAEDDSDAPEDKGGAPKKKGRPKGPAKGPERVTKGAWKHKGERKVKAKEDLDSDGVLMTRPTNCSSESIEHGEQAEYNDEAGMTKDSLHTIVRHAKELESALRSNENLPEWVQEKIGQIKGMMSSVTDYIISTHERDAEQHTGREGITIEPMAEKAVSKAQRKFMGMAHAIQKGERIKGASPELKKVAKTMKPTDTHDFAATKEKGLPKKVKKTDEANDGNLANNAKPYDKVTQGDVVAGRLGKDEQGGKAKKAKEEKVDETTVAGSVATASPSGKSSSGGMQFGKGVYEGFNNSVESMITETMNVSVNMNAGEDGQNRKSITVSADGDDADMLAQLLKAAGLSGQSQGCGCGTTPCSCEKELDENSPDWPTNTETLAAQPELQTYSGGLDGPKSTGQTTVPVVASQERRLHSMAETVELERTLFKTWKNYKG